MKCVICNQRKGKRHCPAKNGLICARCCGEKRLVEIRCPADCPYLADGVNYQSVKTYIGILDWIEVPAQKRQFYETTMRYHEILVVLELEIVNYSQGLRTLTDHIILEAVETLLRTYQTEEKGILYEHVSANPLAQALVHDLQEAIQRQEDDGTGWSRSGIIAALEAIKTQIHYHRAKSGGERPYLEFLLRNRPGDRVRSQDESGIIISS